jgi:hypothetical protein
VTLARGGTVVHRAVPAHLACRIGARAQAGRRNAWPAVVSIALGSFALVFSEVIPVGLLADISGHLRVSIDRRADGGRAGRRRRGRRAAADPLLGPRHAGRMRERVLGVRGWAAITL